MDSRQNGDRDQVFRWRKQQTARPRCVYWWLSQDGAFLSSKVRPPSTKTVQPSLNLQLDNGGGCSHPCPPLDCLKRWQSVMPLFSQIQWACYKKCRKVEWEAQTGMCQWSTPTFENSRRCTALSIPEWKETTEQIDWRAKHAIIKSGLHLGRSEVLRSLRHYLRAQSRGHHTINRLQETGVERGSASRSSLKGRERAIINQMGNFPRQHWGISERRDGGHIRAFLSA